MTGPVPVPDSGDALPVAIHRNPQFRRLWLVGLLVSIVRWMEMLAFGVFTYQQTQSAFWVASLTMLRMLPLAALGMGFGLLATRVSRRKCLIVTQGLMLTTTFVLLVVAAMGALEVWHLALASFINGSVWAGDFPFRRSLMGDAVGAQHFAHAMGLESAATNGSRLVGPTIGGLLLAAGGMPAVLAVSAVLYVAVVATLVGLAEAVRSPVAAPTINGVATGLWAELRATPRLVAALVITLIYNLFCWPVLSMVPVIGEERLALTTERIGVLASMDGLGALLGAMVLIALARRIPHGRAYICGVLLFVTLTPLFALSTHPWLSGLALFGMGLGQSAFAVMQSTLVFLAVPPARRTQAMALLTVCIGVAPLGFLFLGWLAQRAGAPTAIVVCAACAVAAMALTAPRWRPLVQRTPAG